MKDPNDDLNQEILSITDIDDKTKCPLIPIVLYHHGLEDAFFLCQLKVKP